MRRPMRYRALPARAPLMGLVPALLLAPLAACASSRQPAPRAQGDSWELVLPTQLVADVRAGQPLEDLPEFARKDLALGVHTPSIPTALDKWEPPRPDLFDHRYLYLPRGENRFIFFDTPHDRRAGRSRFRAY